MDAQTLAKCTAAQIDRAQKFAEPLSDAMQEFGIDNPSRQSAFLANVSHESGRLTWLTELWGPTIAQQRYEGRRDLGNTQIGDGYRFRGRGLLQTTGRANYQALSNHLGVDYIAEPDRLAQPVDASRSAAYFWQSHSLNQYADAGDFREVCRRINGGFNGFDDRVSIYLEACKALNVAPYENSKKP